MRRVLPPISVGQAKIFLDALQSLQQDNASLIHGWEITSDNSSEDIELLTGIVSAWGNVNELIQLIKATFPENPAN